MKKYVFKIFIISIFLTISVAQITLGQTGWYWQNPIPTGNDYDKIKFLNSKTGFALGWSRTVSKTTNGGVNWVLKNSGVFNANMNSVDFIDSNNIILIGNGIYRTTNGGDNWIFISNQGGTEVKFFNNNTGIIIEDWQNIKRTTDGGFNWSTQSFSYNVWNDLKFISEQTGFASCKNNNNEGGSIYKTTNQGINWNKVYNISGIKTVSNINFINAVTGYALVDVNSLIIKTTNGGDNWISFCNFSQALSTFYGMSVFSDSLQYIASNGSVYKSINSGLNWSSSPTPGLLTSIYFPTRDTGFVVGSGGVIYGTINSGSNWICQSSPYGNLPQTKYVNFPNAQTGYIFGGTNLLKSTDSGEHWNYFDMGNNILGTPSFLGADTFYIACNPNKILRTKNAGATWDSLSANELSQNGASNLHFWDYNNGVASSQDKLFRTSDAGNSWTLIYTGIGGYIGPIQFLNQLTGYYFSYRDVPFGTSYTVFYKTSDGGYNWTNMGILSGVQIKSMKFINEQTGFCISVFTNAKVYKTNNSGVLWSTAVNAGGDYIGFTPPNLVYFMGYKSTNSGSTWFSQTTPFQSYANVTWMHFINEQTGFMTGGYGASIVRTTDGGGVLSAVNEIKPEIVNNFSLQQNYPNPFNPNTKINYEIFAAANVSLKVYDIRGKEIATLVSERKIPGMYIVDFNSVKYGLSSGIYFYRLQTGVFFETKKMLLIK